ncbi:MAG: GNAT family N-acetyltransferase [Hyphomicrobiales bacterium]
MRIRYSEHVWLVETYFDPEAWYEELRDLPRGYEPPGGEILLGRLDGQPAGCVLMRRLGEDVCEMKRLFVATAARGHHLGYRLCEAIVAVARERGYRLMRLDVGFKQPEAKKLYSRLGFVPISAYYDLPAPVVDLMDFMELEL